MSRTAALALALACFVAVVFAYRAGESAGRNTEFVYLDTPTVAAPQGREAVCDAMIDQVENLLSEEMLVADSEADLASAKANAP